MNNLSCEFHDGYWNEYKVISLPVNDLWASVPVAKTLRGKPFYSKVKTDIELNGLKFPLLVVKSSRAEVLKQKRRFGDSMNPLPFWQRDDLNVEMYTVWGGSNRLEIARELGYSTVDCVIVESFGRAHSMQKLHRAPFKNKLY